MLLDILFHSQNDSISKPLGIPDSWPWQCFEVSEETPLHVGATRMTLEELEQYKLDHQAEYDAWYESIE